MSKNYSLSPLENKTLIYLSRVQIKSVTEASLSLGVFRSSLSRTLSKLKKDGLVEKLEGCWCITSKGKEELVKIHAHYGDKFSKSLREAERRFGLVSMFDYEGN